MKRGDRLEIGIERLAYGGDAIGYAPDGRVVFVRGAAPGDTVTVELTNVRKKFLRGHAVDAPQGAAFCPHVDRCGGCPWQRAPRETQRETLRAHLERGLGAPVGLGPETQGESWRATARVHWQDGVVGYHAPGSRDVVDIAACPVLAPPLDRLLTAVRWLKLRGRGTVRLTGQGASGTVTFHPERRTRIELESVLADPACHGAVIVWPDGGRVERGTPSNDINGVTHPAASFVQAHQTGVSALVAEAVAQLRDYGPVTDLFAGSGAFSIALAKAGLPVVAVEIDEAAGAALRAVDLPIQVQVADAASVVINTPSVLLDPPRSGAKGALPAIQSSPANRLVYIACDLAALTRDARLLAENGWTCSHATLHDLFPHTGHGEALAVFERPTP